MLLFFQEKKRNSLSRKEEKFNTHSDFLLTNLLVLLKHDKNEGDEGEHNDEGDRGEELLSAKLDTEEGISVCLNEIQNCCAAEGSQKSADTADSRFDRGSLNEILIIDVVEDDVHKVLMDRSERNSVERGIYVDHPLKRGRGKDIEQISERENGNTKCKACAVGCLIRELAQRL